jgi:hypothetical protein
MKRERSKQTFKLRLLACVLALLLVWYSLNPAPRPAAREKKEAEPPDEKKRAAEPRSVPATLPAALNPAWEPARPSPPADGGDADDFEWPEFIDG